MTIIREATINQSLTVLTLSSLLFASYRLCKEGESSTDQTQSASNVEATSGVSIIPLPPRQKKRTSSVGKSSSSSRLLRSASKEQAATSSKDTAETSSISSISSSSKGNHIVCVYLLVMNM